MSLPVRCFTCGKVIGQYEEEFMKLKDEEKKDFLELKKINRICCRKMLLGYVNLTEILSRYDLSKIV